MNVYPFRFFLSKKGWGKSAQLLQEIKKSPEFKRAHFRVYIPSKGSQKTIIALGQMHTVLTGKISRWAAKKIARSQARLYFYYRYFFNQQNISFFGEEGVTHEIQQGFFRYKLEALQQKINRHEKEQITSQSITLPGLKKILLRLSLKWQGMLKILTNSPEKVAPYADLVSGAMIYSLENPQVLFYAIEGEKAYRYTLTKIQKLEKDIAHCKANPAFQRAIFKGYKKLNQDEYEAVLNCNKKVKMFNKVLGSTLRDEATLQALSNRLEENTVLVYTIGLAHEKNLFKLAPQILKPANISLIMILPPELWFWKGVILWIKRLAFIAIFLACIFLWFFYLQV